MISDSPVIQFTVDPVMDQSFDGATMAPPGTLVDVVNLRRDKNGRAVKREGRKRLDMPANQTGPIRLVPRAGTACSIDRETVFEYSEALDEWEQIDEAPRWELASARPLVAEPSVTHVFAGAASFSSHTAHVWIDEARGAIRLLITDEATGAVVRGPEDVATVYTMARVVTDGTTLWIFGAARATNTLSCWTVSCASALTGGALSSALSVTTGLNSYTSFDIALISTGSVACVYSTTTGYTLVAISNTPAITDTETRAVGSCHSLSCLLSSTLLWIGYAVAATGTVSVIATHTASTLAFLDDQTGPTMGGLATSIGLAPLSSTATLMLVGGYSNGPVGALGGITAVVMTWGGATISAGTEYTIESVTLGSYPFVVGGEVFAWVGLSGRISSYSAYRAYALCCFTTDGAMVHPVNGMIRPHLHTAHGRAFPNLYADSNTSDFEFSYSAPQKVYASTADTNQYVWDAAVTQVAISYTEALRPGVVEYRTDLAVTTQSAMHAAAETCGVTLTSSGSAHVLDGVRMADVGFATPPAFVTYTPDTTGGVIAAGSYQYAVTYEFTDSAGNVYQSSPEFSSTVTHASGSTNKVTVAVPTLHVQSKQDYSSGDGGAVRAVVWRTKDGPQTVFYRVGVATNNPTASTVSFVDIYADSTVSKNAALYISQGELTNEPPPPCRHAVVFGNRIALIDAENEGRIAFSKPLRNGRGPEFSAALETYVRGIGQLVALAEVDGTLYAFSQTGIAVAAYGAGQDSAGGGAWPDPQIVSMAAGSIDARALCVTQDGLLFACGTSDKVRIWLMPRGSSNPVEVGQRVRGYLGASTTLFAGSGDVTVMGIVNNALEQRATVVIRVTTVGGTYATCELDYDYGNKTPDGIGAWSAHVGTPHTNSGPGGASCAMVMGGRLWLASAEQDSGGSRIYVADPTVFADTAGGGDTAAWIAWRIQFADLKHAQTPMFKVNGITTMLEETEGNTRITVSASQDGTFSASTATFDFATVTIGELSPRHWRPPLKRSRAGVGLRLSMSSTAIDSGLGVDSADVLPRAVTVELLPVGNVHRPMAAERV